MLCIQCNTRPVLIKKRQLCSICYQKQRRQRKGKGGELGQVSAEFIKNFFTHNKWFFESIIFKISETETFIPSFYDAKNNVFIQIVTPKRHLKEKYKFFETMFPKIKLELRTVNGEIADYDKWNKKKEARARWNSMLDRCENPKSQSYKNYGGRGIAVCSRWHSFENFYADTGDKPENMTLDRKDNNGNYELENCEWATAKDQYKNSRQARRDKK